jgi:hypothetical protein
MSKNLTLARAREALSYCQETGALHWLIAASSRARVGDVAGYSRADKYRCVRLDGGTYLVHRIAWLLVTGEFPGAGMVVDHIDGDPGNNAWSNLRCVTQATNRENMRAAMSNNQTGMLGVSFDRCRGTWKSTIQVEGRQFQIGRFATADEAYAAYLTAKRTHHVGCTI